MAKVIVTITHHNLSSEGLREMVKRHLTLGTEIRHQTGVSPCVLIQSEEIKEHDSKNCQTCKNMGDFSTCPDTTEWIESHDDAGVHDLVIRDGRVYEVTLI